MYRENPTCSGLENRIQDCPFLVDIETAIDGFLEVNCQGMYVVMGIGAKM